MLPAVLGAGEVGGAEAEVVGPVRARFRHGGGGGGATYGEQRHGCGDNERLDSHVDPFGELDGGHPTLMVQSLPGDTLGYLAVVWRTALPGHKGRNR